MNDKPITTPTPTPPSSYRYFARGTYCNNIIGHCYRHRRRRLRRDESLLLLLPTVVFPVRSRRLS